MSTDATSGRCVGSRCRMAKPSLSRSPQQTTGACAATRRYLFTYYLGSSIFGSIAGVVRHLDGWPAVMTLVLTLCGIVVVLALLVRRTKSLVEGQR